MSYTDFNGNEYDTLEKAMKANEHLSREVESTETMEQQPLPEKLTKKQLLDKIDMLEERQSERYSEYRDFAKRAKESAERELKDTWEYYSEQKKALDEKLEALKKEIKKRESEISEQYNLNLKNARQQYNEVNEEYWEAIHEYQKEYGNGVYAKFYDGKKVYKDFINTSFFTDEMTELSRDLDTIRKLFWL